MTRTEPYKHLRTHPENHCLQWQHGDKVLIIGKTYTDGEIGLDYQPCPLCWPKKEEHPEPMSKPTLEERVAALEWCMHDKFPEYDLVTMVGQFDATSDPQEPYRLDTKPPVGVVNTSGPLLPGVHYYIQIDPKANPKGIPFSVAVEYMKVGRRVRRATWVPMACAHSSMSLPESGIRFMEDVLANDWEVVP